MRNPLVKTHTICGRCDALKDYTLNVTVQGESKRFERVAFCLQCLQQMTTVLELDAMVQKIKEGDN